MIKALRAPGTRFDGFSFMAIGMTDKILGSDVMTFMRTIIKGCPEPLKIPKGGHFVQESGGALTAEKALAHFGLTQK
ncbi:MAG: hypothetical protein HRU33_00015 [Rhodobacteraceae bacterium]|nr:hypothetical protein [Paracoccaceae bacterium]